MARRIAGVPEVSLTFIFVLPTDQEGKSKTVYVDKKNKKREAQALIWSRNYKKFKQLLQEHTQVNYELLKSTKKAKKKR